MNDLSQAVGVSASPASLEGSPRIHPAGHEESTSLCHAMATNSLSEKTRCMQEGSGRFITFKNSIHFVLTCKKTSTHEASNGEYRIAIVHVWRVNVYVAIVHFDGWLFMLIQCNCIHLAGKFVCIARWCITGTVGSTSNLLGQFHDYALRLHISWLLECNVLRVGENTGSACATRTALQKRSGFLTGNLGSVRAEVRFQRAP